MLVNNYDYYSLFTDCESNQIGENTNIWLSCVFSIEGAIVELPYLSGGDKSALLFTIEPSLRKVKF